MRTLAKQSALLTVFIGVLQTLTAPSMRAAEQNQAQGTAPSPHAHSGRHEQAIRAYQEAIRLKPDDSGAWYNLGNTYNDSGQHEQAIRAYQEAIRLKPDDSDAWNNLGSAYAHSGQHEQASRAFQEAIRLKPDYSGAWKNLGIVYALEGNHSGAMQVYEKLKTLDREKADKFFQKFVLP